MAKSVRNKGGSRPSEVSEIVDGMPSRRPIQVGVLDAFNCSAGRVPVQMPPSAQHLIAFLAVTGHGVTRRALACKLWPDSDEARGLARLRNLIWKIGGIEPKLVVAGEQDVQLHPIVRVDLNEARQLATRLLATDGAQPPTVPYRLLENDLLPAWDVEWLAVERSAHKVLRLRALEVVARRRLDESSFYEAEQACRSVILAEPFRESAWLLLAEIHLAEGNVGLALTELDRFAELLKSEIGIDPNPEIREMIASIQSTA